MFFAASRYGFGIREAWPSVPRVQGGREERMLDFLVLPPSLRVHPFFLSPVTTAHTVLCGASSYELHDILALVRTPYLPTTKLRTAEPSAVVTRSR